MSEKSKIQSLSPHQRAPVTPGFASLGCFIGNWIPTLKPLALDKTGMSGPWMSDIITLWAMMRVSGVECPVMTVGEWTCFALC